MLVKSKLMILNIDNKALLCMKKKTERCAAPLYIESDKMVGLLALGRL